MAIGWALLGTGRHPGNNVLPQIQHASDTKLVAVLSRDQARGEEFAKKHGFKRAYSILKDVLQDPEVDAVYDATPDGLHAKNVIEIARAGKHCLIEKPLGISVRECSEAIKACMDHKVKLGVVFQQRHDPVHQAARRMVQEGKIGDIVLVRGQLSFPRRPEVASRSQSWRADPKMRPGGVVMGAGDHVYDTLGYLIGREITEVTAFTDNSSNTEIPNERVAGMMLKFAGGCIGWAVASSKTPFGQQPFEIHGTEGSIRIHNTYSFMTGSEEDARLYMELQNSGGKSVQYFEPAECFRLEIEHFNKCIQNNTEPMTSGVEGMRAQAITESVYESARTERVVRVSEVLSA